MVVVLEVGDDNNEGEKEETNMETKSKCFRCSSFRIDVLDQNEVVTTMMEYPQSEEA